MSTFISGVSSWLEIKAALNLILIPKCLYRSIKTGYENKVNVSSSQSNTFAGQLVFHVFKTSVYFLSFLTTNPTKLNIYINRSSPILHNWAKFDVNFAYALLRFILK